METGEVHEACAYISRCCRQARGAQAPPNTEEIEDITVEREDLYMCRPPEGLKVPQLLRKSDIKGGILTEAEVDEAVWGRTGGRAGGPSGMRAEDLKGCLREATRTKDPEQRKGGNSW